MIANIQLVNELVCVEKQGERERERERDSEREREIDRTETDRSWYGSLRLAKFTAMGSFFNAVHRRHYPA